MGMHPRVIYPNGNMSIVQWVTVYFCLTHLFSQVSVLRLPKTTGKQHGNVTYNSYSELMADKVSNFHFGYMTLVMRALKNELVLRFRKAYGL